FRGTKLGLSAPAYVRALAACLTIYACLMLPARAFAAVSNPDTDRLALDALLQARQVYALAHTTTHSQAVDARNRRERLVIAELVRIAEVAQNPGYIRHLAIMQRVTNDPNWRASLLRLPILAHSTDPF